MNNLSTGNIALFLTPEMLRNRYDMYAMIRQTQPVLRLDDHALSLVFGYDDVSTVLSDYANFSSDLTQAGPMHGSHGNGADGQGEMFGQSLITNDPPRHRRLRDLVMRAFTPRAVTNLE